jgi:ATP-binding cassette, subfamily C (CFTR/MRP), member 1
LLLSLWEKFLGKKFTLRVHIFAMFGSIDLHPRACPAFPDNSFGPAVAECERAFDFTLLFEESILSIGPSVLLLLFAPLRILSLSNKRRKVGGKPLQLVKLV